MCWVDHLCSYQETRVTLGLVVACPSVHLEDLRHRSQLPKIELEKSTLGLGQVVIGQVLCGCKWCVLHCWIYYLYL